MQIEVCGWRHLEGSKWNLTDLNTHFARVSKLVSHRESSSSSSCLLKGRGFVLTRWLSVAEWEQRHLLFHNLRQEKEDYRASAIKSWPQRIIFKWHIYLNLKGLCWLLKIMKSISIWMKGSFSLLICFYLSRCCGQSRWQRVWQSPPFDCGADKIWWQTIILFDYNFILRPYALEQDETVVVLGINILIDGNR